MTWTFEIPGPAVGYYTRGARPNWTRMKQYHHYRDHVVRCAQIAGLRPPLTASEASRLRIDVRLHSKGRVHPDPENIRKGVVDALFYRAGKSDRYVWGTLWQTVYDVEPKVIVVVTT